MGQAGLVFLVCAACGLRSHERPVVDGFVVCDCGHRWAWALRTLFVLTGASGSGKTTVAARLIGTLTDPAVFDADILWGPEMNTPEDGYARLHSTWLRLVANLAQSGHSTLLAGSRVPGQFESRPERRYVGDIRYLALVASREVLAERLRARPPWRCVTQEVVARMLEFNALLADWPDVDKLDTSVLTLDETCSAVTEWLRAQEAERIRHPQPAPRGG